MKKSLKLPTTTISIFLTILLVYFAIQQNFEFIGYTIVTSLLYLAVIKADKKYNFPTQSVWLFAIWIAMHLLGGSVYIDGTRLYDLILINMFNGGGEFMMLKYDQFVHAYCYFAISILVYFVLKKHMKKDQQAALVTFTILSAIGIGLLNEVIEFIMVVFADAAEAVGGYYNTALDLVFNLIGAIIGTLYSTKFLDR